MKNIVQDIIPPGKKSIRQISRSTEARVGDHEDAVTEGSMQSSRNRPTGMLMREKPKKTKIWISVLVVSVLFLAAFHVFFSGASVTVVPQSAIVAVSSTFSAEKDGSSSSRNIDIVYRTMTLESEYSQAVASTGEEEVEIKASGNIIIFNNYSNAEQRLIKNTRFATPDGLEYRILQSVVVPGKYKKDGVNIPGSIEVTVYADQAGAEYNLGLTDFVIPWFKDNDPERFQSFYARSKTPMEGGFVGIRKTISSADRATAQEEAYARLENELRGLSESEIPEGYLQLESADSIVFSSLPNTENADTVTLNESAIFTTIIIDKGQLSQLIAKETLTLYESGQKVMIDNFDEMSIKLIDSEIDSEEGLQSVDGKINISVTGEASVVWEVDEDSLKAELAGKSRDEIPSVVLDHPELDEITASFWPFWKSSFPEDVAKISIEQKLD